MSKEYNEMVMVTDWERVEVDNFYLIDEKWVENWNPEDLQRAKELQAKGHLYIAYVIPAVHYAIYSQMDARQIFIDEDGDELMSCETAIIANHHEHQEEYGY